RQPIETSHDITNAFDGITYQKSAAVLAMLEHYVGDEPFRRGLHDFLVAHAQSRWRAIGATTADATWTIPVCVRAGIAGRVEQACTVLAAPTGALDLPGCADWVMPNAHAAGYYRATLPPDDLARLRDRGRPQLSVAERVQLANDLDEAFRSGSLPGGEVLRALEPLARDAHGAVALIPL